MHSDDLGTSYDVIVIGGGAAGLSDDRIIGVRLTDSAVVPREVMVVQTRMEARASFLADLALAPIEHPMGIGSYVPADPTGLTAVHGVYVAGNITDLTAQVGAAAAAGALAGARINADLVEEETDLLEQQLVGAAAAISVTTTDASAAGRAAHWEHDHHHRGDEWLSARQRRRPGPRPLGGARCLVR